MLKKIPKTLKLILVKKLKESEVSHYHSHSSNDGRRLFLINPVPSKNTSSVKLHDLYRYHYNNYNEEELYYEFIQNTGFKIRLNYNTYRYRNYTSMPTIEVYHEKFKDLPYQPIIYINYTQLLNLLGRYGGNLGANGEFPGTYKIEIVTTGHYPIYEFICEDNMDHRSLVSSKYGELLETVKRTSTWIPGNVYVLSNRDVVLYLGSAKNIKYRKRYYTYSNEIINLFSTDFYSIDYLFGEDNSSVPYTVSANNSLVVRLFNYRTNTEDFSYFFNPDLSRIVSVKDFISTFIRDLLIDNKSDLGFIKLGDKTKQLAAIDLGKLVNFSSDFYKDNVLEDIINELSYNIENNKIVVNDKTKGIFLSEYFIKLNELPQIKYESLKFVLQSYKYLFDFYAEKYPSISHSNVEDVIKSVINYTPGDCSDWRSGSLTKFSKNFKTLLDGDSRFGEVDKDALKNIIIEIYDK